MDADGSDVGQLTPDTEGRSLSQPTWSPDGRRIVYVDGQSISSAVQSRYGNLVLITDDGSGRRRITTGPDADPDWSPDGRDVVFVHGENLPTPEANDDIWVLDLETGAKRRLTDTPPDTYEAAPAWSPDGSRIAFVRYTGTSEFDGTASIHVVNRDGSAERELLAHKLFAYAPYSLAWSPDGKSIAFETSSTIGCTSISLLDVGDGTTRPLTTCSRPREATVAPAWQPAPNPSD
jgi:TolB protein